MDESAKVISVPFLIKASQYTIELLCCGVAKIVSVVDSPEDEGGRALTVSVSGPTLTLFIYQIVNSST